MHEHNYEQCPHCYESTARWIDNQLEELDDELKEKIVPLGSDTPISPEPDVDVNETDIDNAIELFTIYIVANVGILLAEPIGDAPDDDEQLYDDYDNDWAYYYEDYYYYNTETVRRTLRGRYRRNITKLFGSCYCVYGGSDCRTVIVRSYCSKLDNGHAEHNTQ